MKNPNATHVLTAVARDAAGNTATSDGVIVNVNNGGALPAEWASQDIGAVGAAGSATHDSGIYTVAGAGAGIFGTADEFQFVHQQITGDCTIIARVASIQDVDGVAWEHAGVMIRETLAANSAYTGVYQTPTNGVLFEQRSVAGGSAASAGSATGSLSWLKLVRSGNVFTASRSSDGTNWTTVGMPQTITMAATVYVGLAVSSEVDATTSLATFDNVTTTTPDTTAPTVSITAPADGSATSGTINVNATASDNVGVAGVQFQLNGANLGAEDTISPFGTSWDSTTTSNGTHVLTAMARDAANNKTTSAGVIVNVNNGGALPAGWSGQDIGAVGAAGSATHTSGVYTVAGAGGGIFGTADEFQFVHQQLTGDCTIIARVASVQDVDGVDWEHAGVMIRETLTADSAYAGVYQTPSTPGNGVIFERRSTTGASAANAGSATGNLSWLKLSRLGNEFRAWRSSDNVIWTQIGTMQTISMTGTVYVGLAVSSEADAATCLATFDNVKVTDVGESGGTPLFTPGITEPAGGPAYTNITRWVDFNAPDDNGLGTQASPWKYAPGMPNANAAHTAVAGDVIALKRGRVWRLTGAWNIPSSGDTTAGPIVYTAYDDPDDPNAPLPKVTVLENIKGVTGTWTQNGGTNVWSRAVTGTVERLYLNGVGLGEATGTTVGGTNWVGQTNTVTCIREPNPNLTPGTGPGQINDGKTWSNGTWVLDGTTPTTHNTTIVKSWKQLDTTLYLHSPDGNPSTLSSIEALKADTATTELRFAVYCRDRSHVYLDRIAFQGGTEAVVNIEATGTSAPTNVRVTNCDVRCAKQKGIRVYSQSTDSTGFTNGQIKWNRVDSGDGLNTRVVLNDAQYGSLLDKSGSDPADLQSFPGEGRLGSNDGISLWDGVQGWIVAQNDVSNFWHTLIKVARNTTDSLVAHTSGNILEHNNAHAENINYSHGIEITCGGAEALSYRTHGNIIRYNKVYDTWVASAFHGRNNKFYGNLIMGVYGSPRYCLASNSWRADGIQVNGFDDPNTAEVIDGGVIAYNTIVNVGGAAVGLVGSPGKIQHELVIANNIMAYCGYRRYSSNGTPYYIAFRDQNNQTSTIDVDNNVIYSPDATAIYEHTGHTTRITVNDMETMEAGSWDMGWTGNIPSSPMFVSYPGTYFSSGTADGYKLQPAPTSPANGTAGAPKAKPITAHIPESTNWHDIGCWQVP